MINYKIDDKRKNFSGMSLVMWKTIEGAKQSIRHIKISQWNQKDSERKEYLDIEERADSNQSCYAIEKKGLDSEDRAHSNQTRNALQA